MAIAYLTGNTGQNASASSLSTGSFTVSGSNTFLVAAVRKTGSTITVNSVLCNSVAGTLLQSGQSVGAGGSQVTVYFYYWIAPAAGSRTIDVTLSSSASVAVTAALYTGVIQTSPVETSDAAGSGTASDTLSSTALNCWHIIVGATDGNASNVAAGTGTLRATNWTSVIDTNGPISPPGSDTLSYTTGGQGPVGVIGAIIKPFVTTATLTESMSSTERLTRGRVFQEVITMTTVFVTTFTELLSMSDTGLFFKKSWKSLAKNAANWINQTKH